MSKILIQVKKGAIISVKSDDPNIKVVLMDHDWEHPEPVELEKDEVMTTEALDSFINSLETEEEAEDEK